MQTGTGVMNPQACQAGPIQGRSSRGQAASGVYSISAFKLSVANFIVLRASSAR